MNKLTKVSISGAVMLAALAALPILADEISASPSRSPNVSRAPKSTVSLACMQNAVDKRDSAIISAVGAYSSAAQSALNARKSALMAAWALTDAKARRTAVRLAWKNYDLALRNARNSFAKSKRAAWEQFKKDTKTCRSQGETTEDQGHDSQL